MTEAQAKEMLERLASIEQLLRLVVNNTAAGHFGGTTTIALASKQPVT